jgi:hypothetical protein
VFLETEYCKQHPLKKRAMASDAKATLSRPMLNHTYKTSRKRRSFEEVSQQFVENASGRIAQVQGKLQTDFAKLSTAWVEAAN